MLQRVVFGLMLALLVLVQFAFGGVHVWSSSAMVLFSVIGVLAAWMLPQPRRTHAVKEPGWVPWVSGVFLLCVACLWMTTVPLPEGLVQVLSPEAYALYHQAASLSGEGGWMPLSVTPAATRMGLVRFLGYGAFAAALWTLVTSRRRIRIVLGVLLGMGLFQVLYGAAQTYGGEQQIWWWTQSFQYVGDVTGTYINRNHLAGFLELVIPMGFGWLVSLAPAERKRSSRSTPPASGDAPVSKDDQRQVRRSKKVRRGARSSKESERRADTGVWLRFKLWLTRSENRSKRILLGGILVALGAGLLLTDSRGGILSCALGVAFLCGLLVSRHQFRRLAWVGVGLCVLIAIYGGFLGLGRTLERFERIDSGLAGRLNIYKHAFPLVGEFPWTGSGIGTFKDVYFRVAPPEGSGRVAWHYAHNDWLQLAIETGIPGFLVGVSVALFLFVAAWRQWRHRRDPFAIGIGGGMLAAMVAIAVHSFFDFNMHIPANVLTLITVFVLGWRALILRHRG